MSKRQLQLVSVYFTEKVKEIDEDTNEEYESTRYLPTSTVLSEGFNILGERSVEVLYDVEITVKWCKGSVNYHKNFDIPKGYKFDGASIPRIFWDSVGKPTDKKFLVAALVHDYLYEGRWYRDVADEVFFYILEQEGVAFPKAALMYAAVRLGGFTFYAGDTSSFWRSVRKIF